MPSSTLWRVRRDDLVDALGTMSKANGFYLDYGRVLVGRWMTRANTADSGVPPIGCVWVPPEAANEMMGSEKGAQRSRGYHGFALTVYVTDRGGDHDGRAYEVAMDLEKAVLTTDSTIGLDRTRGSSGRDFTLLSDPDWDPDVLEGQGGTLMRMARIRMDHQTTDATAQG